MSITMKELNSHNFPMTPEIDENLGILLNRINLFRHVWGKDMYVTSGLRSAEEQARLIKAGRSTATKSLHLKGAAVDIFDHTCALYNFCKANEQLLIDCQLWCEERQGPWQHFQIFPPKSKKRWFNP